MNKELIKYLQQDSIGLVVAQGLAELYTNKPKTPVKFLADWLKKYSSNQRQLQKICQQQRNIRSKENVYNENMQKQAKDTDLKKNQQKEKNNIIDLYMKKIEDHEYHAELLEQDLPEFIQKHLKLAGVYIGYVNHPRKQITDQDEDPQAHVDFSVPKVINYIGTSKSHSNLLLNQTLALQKGVTAKALSLQLQDPQPNEEGIVQKRDKYVYIPNVVKNESIHYFRLPKLGSYIAIPLVYNSYLTQKLYDAAYQARILFLQELAQCQKGKVEELKQIQTQIDNLKDKLEQLIEKNGDNAAIQALRQEIKDSQAAYKEKSQEKFEEQVQELSTQKIQYVVCADTLGQDRQISQNDRTFLIKLVKHFRDSWQNKQKSLLYKDIDHQLSIQSKLSKKFTQYIDHLNKLMEITPQIKAQFDQIQDQILRQHRKQSWQITQLISQLKINTQFRDNFVELKKFRIIKYQQLIQAILYFNLINKKDINSKGKTTLDWKNIKERYISYDTFDSVLKYQSQGPKHNDFKAQSKIAYLKEKFQKFNQSQIFKYNIGLGSLLFVIKKFINHRLNDIHLRKQQKEKQRKQRQAIIQQNDKLTENKNHALQKYKQALPSQQASSFNEEEWLNKYESENPLKEVPDEIVEDIDNDN